MLDDDDDDATTTSCSRPRRATTTRRSSRRGRRGVVVLAVVMVWALVTATIMYDVTTLSSRISSSLVEINIRRNAAPATSNTSKTTTTTTTTTAVLLEEDAPTSSQNTNQKQEWKEPPYFWNRYPLADLIKYNNTGATDMVSDLCSGGGGAGGRSQHHHQQQQQSSTKLIVCQYRNRTTENSNIAVLIQVLEDQQQRQFENTTMTNAYYYDNNNQKNKLMEFPSSDELVVHLRLGDGLCTQEPNRFQKRHCRWDHRRQIKMNSTTASIASNTTTTTTTTKTTTTTTESNYYLAPDCWNDIRDCYGFDKKVPYALSRSHYQPLIDTLQALLLSPTSSATTTTIRQITLVSDVRHWGWDQDPRPNNNYTVDWNYRHQVAQWFSSTILNNNNSDSDSDSDNQKNKRTIKKVVVFRNGEELNRTPDQDFQYMSAARWFVPSGGGYSQLISQVVQARGGTVLRPKGIR